MSAEAKPGRVVEVHTKFHAEATKPGGVSRDGAKIVARQSVADLQADLKREITASLDPLIALLGAWNNPSRTTVETACQGAALVRDMAGLAELRLLTEVAMHTFDCLDAVLIDDVTLAPAEAKIYANALLFARADACRGKDLAPYTPLLRDLSALTDHVLERAAA